MSPDVHAIALIRRRAGNTADEILRFQNDGMNIRRFRQKLVGGRKPRRSRADNQYSLFLHRSPVQLLYLRLLSREKRLFRCILNKNFYKKIITRRQEKVKEIPLFYLPAFSLRFS